MILGLIPAYEPFFSNFQNIKPELKPYNEIINLEEWKAFSVCSKFHFADYIVGFCSIYVPSEELALWSKEKSVLEPQIRDLELQEKESKLKEISDLRLEIGKLETKDRILPFLQGKYKDLKFDYLSKGIDFQNDPPLMFSFIETEIEYWEKVNDYATFPPIEKIKWNGSPSQFGYIFSELAAKNFIESPVKSGELNFTGLAKLLLKHFDVNSTPENVIKEMNPNKNSLTETKRVKFPNLSDIA